MKIERITCRVVDFPLNREFRPAWARGRNQPNLLMVLIEVQTDDGETGVGAAHAGLEAAVTIERFVAPYFIGQDPTYVERLAPVLRVEDVQRMLAEGYRAVKFRFHLEDPREDLKVVEAVRAAVGDRIEIMVDANQAGVEPGHGGHRNWGFPLALKVARELERMHVR